MLNRCLKAAFPCGLGCFALILTPMILAADLKLETKLLAANVELQRTNKGLSKQLLMQDQQVLKEVAVSVRPTFENRGFSNEDLNAAIVTGCSFLRFYILIQVTTITLQFFIFIKRSNIPVIFNILKLYIAHSNFVTVVNNRSPTQGEEHDIEQFDFGAIELGHMYRL